MPRSFLHRNWEISSAPEVKSGGAEKGDRNAAIYADEKSDVPVVPKKSPNKALAAEVVEGRGTAKSNAEEPPACRTQRRENASMGLLGVREVARRKGTAGFSALLHHITPSLLVESFYDLNKAAAAGVDGINWRDYEERLYGRVHDLHREIQSGAYRAVASRRVYIPKADGKQRALGVAAIEDKIVQQAVVKVLSAIYEDAFLGFSYGFRPGRSQHDALDALTIGITEHRIGWILDADISAFFDTIDHDWLMRFLSHRIADKRLLRLIQKWLKAGIIEEGRRIEARQGTPQGAVISPMLSNIYLHYVLDLWAHQWRKKAASGDVILIRYADDSVMGFQYEDEAKRFLVALKERLAKFGLTLHPDKTRLIEFGRYAATRRKRRGLGRPETFDFMGFTHCCSQTRRGWFTVLRLTNKKRMRLALEKIRQQLKRHKHDAVARVGKWLQRVVQGYFNYHAVPGNLKRLTGFRNAVIETWRKALRRRSQRSNMNWQRFKRLVKLFIPSVRQMHPYPSERFRGMT